MVSFKLDFNPIEHQANPSETALKTLIADTESSFRSESQAKQSLIDQEQARLRTLTANLADDRSKLLALEAKANLRSTLKHQIATLRRLNAEKRQYLSTTGNPPLSDISIGDADNGLAITNSLLRPQQQTITTTPTTITPPTTSTPSSTPQTQIPPRTPSQESYISSLPASYLLQARARAYAQHNAILESRKQDLINQSSVLERKLRRVVVLSTGIEEAKVVEKVDRLAAAIQSEEGEEMDMGRVREFLRRLGEEGG